MRHFRIQLSWGPWFVELIGSLAYLLVLLYFLSAQPDLRQALGAICGFLLCASSIWYVEFTHTAKALATCSLAEVNQARRWVRFLEMVVIGMLLPCWLWLAQERLVKPLLTWGLFHLGLLLVGVLVGFVIIRRVLPLLWKLGQALAGRQTCQSLGVEAAGALASLVGCAVVWWLFKDWTLPVIPR